MNEDRDKVIAQWSNVNATIDQLATMKASMTTADYNAQQARLFSRKRMLLARLRSFQRVTKDDLRFQITGAQLYEP